MTTKEQYEAVVDNVDLTLSDLHILETSLGLTDLNVDEQITIIENALLVIVQSAQSQLDVLEQQQVMTSFLAEMKVVFDKYAAKIEIGSNSTGYGESYGDGETAVGIKLTATFEGVTATKEINKSVIVSEDLV